MKPLSLLLAFKLVVTISMTLVKYATTETMSAEMVAHKGVSPSSLLTSAPLSALATSIVETICSKEMIPRLGS